LIFGVIELFQSTGDAHWLELALTLQRRQDDLFWDAQSGGWFNTTGEDPSVILRMKEDYDGAEPSPSSISVLNLLRLAHLTNDPGHIERIEKTLKMFGPRLGQLARAVPMTMAALSTYHAKSSQIVIVGPRGDERTDLLLRAVESKYDPFSVVIPVEPGRAQEDVARLLPFVAPMSMRDGQPAAYVCRDFTCNAPVTDPKLVRTEG
jgi:uncharacterized protein YyaL (SSP411 family)